jgi:iron complex outermembrane receptor protein
VAAANAFNKYPSTVPYSAQSASTKAQYINAWDNSGPVGLLGGTYYARVEFKY